MRPGLSCKRYIHSVQQTDSQPATFMIPSKENSGNQISFLFILSAIFCLLSGLIFGMLGSIQYIVPGFLNDTFSFARTRPLHVSLVITWIYTAAIGFIYYSISSGKKLWSPALAKLHLMILAATGLTILGCYICGIFGGREYFEFPPWLSVPMLVTWILFAINFFKTASPRFLHAPVYIWMWTTGIVAFSITFLEQYLWLFPFFRDNIIRDVIIQWKSLGSLVGSWNQLVYGTAFFVMEKISGDEKTTRSPKTFFFYFLGLTNLLFNWGHHTYIVPASPWIKNVSYFISMTELLLLGSILYSWRKTLDYGRKNFHLLPYRFLFASDIWIFINLALAIAISIPGVNAFTHGTHVTVAQWAQPSESIP